RRDEQVLRYLCIKLDKHAAKYNERRRNGEFNKPKVKETAAPEAAKSAPKPAPVAKAEPTTSNEEV
ncbi:MAG: hypothetical protein QMC70_12015, partial [Bacteroidia bacterium]